MTGGDRERLESLSALCAAGAATEQERAELESILAERPEAADEVRAWNDTAAALALALEPVEPPAGALDRIRGAIRAGEAGRSDAGPAGADESAAPPAKVISLARRAKRRAFAVAAISAAAAAVAVFFWLREREAVRDLRGQVAAEVRERDRAVTEVRREYQDVLSRTQRELDRLRARYQTVRSPSVRLVTMQGDASGVAKLFVEPERRRWLVLAFELPPFPDKDYQLWFVPPDGQPIDAGLLEVGPDGVLSAVPEVPEGLEQLRPAISLEPKGGSEQPTDIKMIGDLI